MARSYSQDLRDRVIEATESGTSARKAAARFEVAASTAIKWLERLRDSGERSARRQGRRPGSKLDAHRDFLLAAVEAEPDSTLGELQRRLVEERGVRAGIGTIWTFLDRYDLTFKKKSAYAAEQNRPVPSRPGTRFDCGQIGTARARVDTSPVRQFSLVHFKSCPLRLAAAVPT